jgi:hypothetical protein
MPILTAVSTNNANQAIARVKIPIEKSQASLTLRCLFGENSMDQLTVPSRPLCVDMDGTLLETDTMEELIVSFLRARQVAAVARTFPRRTGRLGSLKRLLRGG